MYVCVQVYIVWQAWRRYVISRRRCHRHIALNQKASNAKLYELNVNYVCDRCEGATEYFCSVLLLWNRRECQSGLFFSGYL